MIATDSKRLTRRSALAAILLACLGPACGDSPGPAAVDAAPPAGDPDASLPDAGPPRACDGAVFETIHEHDVDGLAFNLGSSSKLVTSPGGRLHAAFTDSVESTGVIVTADRGDDGWTEPVQVSGTEPSSSSPSMVEHDGTLHLAWTHRPRDARTDPNKDIYYASRPSAGGAWAAPANITGIYESELQRDGNSPSLASGPDGELVVAYESGARDPLFGPIQHNTAGRVIEIVEGAPAGPPVEVIPPSFEGCYVNHARFSADGVLHVVSICDEGQDGPDEFDWSVYRAIRTGGQWSEARRAGLYPSGLAATTGPDGVIHAAWFTWCVGTQQDCGFVSYAVLSDDDLETPVVTVPAPTDSFVQGIAVRQDGRVVITVSRVENDVRQVLVLDSADGATFDLCDLTPSADDDENGGDVAFDPDTGEVVLVFGRTTPTATHLELARIP